MRGRLVKHQGSEAHREDRCRLDAYTACNIHCALFGFELAPAPESIDDPTGTPTKQEHYPDNGE